MMNTILLASVVWLIFTITSIGIGVCMYRLGLHGQIRRYTRMMEDAQAPAAERTEKEPTRVPGQEYHPDYSGYTPGYNYLSAEDLDEEDLYVSDEDIEEAALDKDHDPVVPQKVVMTGGGIRTEETV